MGICYYRLGNIEKAKFAFNRLLELEPNNSIAMVALAIIE
jgi:Flp pilus assembly protein TadD